MREYLLAITLQEGKPIFAVLTMEKEEIYQLRDQDGEGLEVSVYINRYAYDIVIEA